MSMEKLTENELGARRACRGTNLYISEAVINAARGNLKSGESLSSLVEKLLSSHIAKRSPRETR